MKDFAWYQYFFTQWRALFVYLGMFLWPAKLTLDWDFPISRTVLDHGAILWLADAARPGGGRLVLPPPLSAGQPTAFSRI